MPDILIDNKNIYKFEITFLTVFSIITKLTVVLFLIGFFQEKPLIFLKIHFIVKFLLGLFLMYRFNRYRKHKIEFTELDRKICYSAGIYIIIVSLGDYLTSLSYEIRKQLIGYTHPLVNPIRNELQKYNLI